MSDAANPKDKVGSHKVPLSCVPFNVLFELGLAMFEGASKYGRHNYRAVPIRASVYFDACMRHMGAWWEGEDTDPDSNLSHVTKAIATLVVLRDSMMQGKLVDDRAPPSTPFMDSFNRRAAYLKSDYGGRDVKHYTKEDPQ